jgi:hypothetical protein
MFDLQQLFCRALDVFGNLVPVSRAKQQRAENQHVEGALQELDAISGFVWHISVVILP